MRLRDRLGKRIHDLLGLYPSYGANVVATVQSHYAAKIGAELARDASRGYILKLGWDYRSEMRRLARDGGDRFIIPAKQSTSEIRRLVLTVSRNLKAKF